MIRVELDAFAAQINLKLLGSIVSFVTQTTKASSAQKTEMRRRCIFSDFPGDSNAMQQKYGFLYLGELLERYEERFGMTPQDRRAIALALGYTRDIAADGMFVGSQRTNFIQSIRRSAPGDIYLTGALYLLHEGQSDGLAYETQLKEWQYDKTEELIFAMSLFQDTEQALAYFKPHLSRLLGKGRTMPVFGNTHILQWVMAELFPLKKLLKAKDMAVIRALLSLPVSYVKEGSKHHGWLLEHGYTPIEIAYANTAALGSQCVPGGPGRNSITAEKLVVALFRTVLAHDQALPDEVYQQLSQVYQMYARFEVKLYGKYQLADTLEGGLRIQTPETMAWFIRRSGEPLHPATMDFDIMDPKWDPLAKSLDKNAYQSLFERSLTEEMDAAQIRERLDHYQALTGKNYTDWYSESAYAGSFSLLVRTGVIDLWTAFQSCLSKDGGVSDATLLRHIKDYCDGVKTVQAFEFLRRFLHQYGYPGMKKYLDRYSSGFERELWEKKGYNDGPITLDLQRDFLTDDPEQQRLLLHWLDEYFFTMKPEYYLNFAQAVLEDEQVAALLLPEDQRGIFDVLISQSKLSVYDANQLKRRYLTPEEQQAEQEANKAAEAERKRRTHLEMVQAIEGSYADFIDGSFGSVVKYLDKYHYYDDKEAIAHRVVYDRLEQLLQDNGYALAPAEADRFLIVCRELRRSGTLDWAELQSYILKVKEVKRDDPDGDPTE